MLNQVVLVGRLTKNVEVKDFNEKKVAVIELAVQRSFKNEKGEYEIDNIEITLWNRIAENTAEYCIKGDIIGVKGRLQTEDDRIKVIAEKITFLSSKSDK